MKAYYRMQVQLFAKKNQPKTSELIGGKLRVPMFDPRAPASYHFKEAENPECVITPIVIANPRTPLTDCIYGSAAAAGYQTVISDFLKNILAKQRHPGLQFFPTPVIHSDIEYRYWMMNPFRVDRNFVDFKQSTVFMCKPHGGSLYKIEVPDLKTYEDLIAAHKDNAIKIDRVVFTEDAPDFIILSVVEVGLGYYFSEEL